MPGEMHAAEPAIEKVDCGVKFSAGCGLDTGTFQSVSNRVDIIESAVDLD